MADRVKRAMLAVAPVPRVTAGSTRYCHPPSLPDDGSHWSETEKTRISMIPCQKAGMPTPLNAPTHRNIVKGRVRPAGRQYTYRHTKENSDRHRSCSQLGCGRQAVHNLSTHCLAGAQGTSQIQLDSIFQPI